MAMRLSGRFTSALALLLALPALAAAQGAPNFATYVSIGDSLAAGFVSGSLVENHQVNSVPALLARQANAGDFQLPLITQPGIPPELTLVSLSPVPTVARKAGLGSPRNLGLARPYNNLAVPGATLPDVLQRVTDGGGLHDVILRGRGTQLAQATALRPTFVTVWIGNNDVLGAAVSGRAIEGVTLTPAVAFRGAYQQLISALRATGATVVAANLPDVTTIPFVTTVPPVVVNPATSLPLVVNGATFPLLGPSGPLSADTRVTLSATTLLAQGIGIPAALGGRAIVSGGACVNCLPDEVILDPGEIALIRSRVDANNAAIEEICRAAGVAVVDIHGLLNDFFFEGRLVGGIPFTSSFLTGGIFSYDGVHPTDLGYAITANEWIRVINQNGGSLEPVNLAPFLGVGGASTGVTAFQLLGRPLPDFTLEAWESLREVFPPVDLR
jgi:lysophospholipase L1-like esterase